MGSDEHDGALVEAWKRGKTEAVARVVDAHGPAMTRVALALCPALVRHARRGADPGYVIRSRNALRRGAREPAVPNRT
jgi:hypothetical protein